MATARYVPALRFERLTRIYDPIARLTTRESEFKRRIVDALAPMPDGARILDVGCGTGTLAILLARAFQTGAVTGIDGDPAVLSRARAKAHEAQVGIDFDSGLATALPYAEASFDAAVSTLLLHHLDRDAKAAATRELARVLKPGGELLLADWGRPADPLAAAGFLLVRALDGFDVTADNAAGLLPQTLEAGGLEDVRELDRLRTPLGTVYIWRARRARI